MENRRDSGSCRPRNHRKKVSFSLRGCGRGLTFSRETCVMFARVINVRRSRRVFHGRRITCTAALAVLTNIPKWWKRSSHAAQTSSAGCGEQTRFSSLRPPGSPSCGWSDWPARGVGGGGVPVPVPVSDLQNLPALQRSNRSEVSVVICSGRVFISRGWTRYPTSPHPSSGGSSLVPVPNGGFIFSVTPPGGQRCRPTADSNPSWWRSACGWRVLPVFVWVPLDSFGFLLCHEGSPGGWFCFNTGKNKGSAATYPRRSCIIQLFLSTRGGASSDGAGGEPAEGEAFSCSSSSSHWSAAH